MELGRRSTIISESGGWKKNIKKDRKEGTREREREKRESKKELNVTPKLTFLAM